MARPRQKNLVERLADVGEEAIQRLGNAPGADKLAAALSTARDAIDDLQKRVRGLENLEKRLKALERRLDKLEGKGKSTSRKTSAAGRRKTSSTSRKT
jgi:predicted  nucleic acid-binding Zn-ribbon protein